MGTSRSNSHSPASGADAEQPARDAAHRPDTSTDFRAATDPSTGAASPAHEPRTAQPRQKALVLNAPRHWEAITSPTRFEILEQMRSAAPCSVAELARQMDRPADGLYHHLRKLLEASLIREVGQRPVGKQVEAVYDLSFDTLLFEVDPLGGRNVNEMRKLAGSLLRLCGRVFDAALGNPEMLGSGPRQNTWGRLDTTWLTDEALAEVNEHLTAIKRLTIEGNRRRDGQLVTLGTFGGPALRPRRADGLRNSAAPRPVRGAKATARKLKPARLYHLGRVSESGRNKDQ